MLKTLQIKCSISIKWTILEPIKRNQVLIHATTWMNLENMLNKRSRHKRSQIEWFHLREMSRRGKSIEKESRLVVPGTKGGRNGDWLMGFFLWWWKLFWNYIMVMADQLCEYINAKNQWIIHFKRMNFMAYMNFIWIFLNYIVASRLKFLLSAFLLCLIWSLLILIAIYTIHSTTATIL